MNTENDSGKFKISIEAQFEKGRLEDARQKILSRKMKGATDDRDTLANMAKTKDARNSLDKIRQTNNGGISKNSNATLMGTNIVKKTDRDGKLSLFTTNKSRCTKTMKMTILRELGFIPPPRGRIPENGTPAAPKVFPVMKRVLPAPKKKVTTPYQYENAHENQGPHTSSYKWTNPASSQIISIIERPLRSEDLDKICEDFSISRPLRTRAYIDLDAIEDEEIFHVPSLRTSVHLRGTSRSPNIRSGLDTSAPQAESQGIFPKNKINVVVPSGYRIVVSNLQDTVSEEDIKELFEDIGDLLDAQLVRPGVAEVIYKNLRDARKACEKYHNRQLDGQPMKCLLVDERPFNNPTKPIPPKHRFDNAASFRTVSSANKIIPDLQTIHKALFHS